MDQHSLKVFHLERWYSAVKLVCGQKEITATPPDVHPSDVQRTKARSSRLDNERILQQDIEWAAYLSHDKPKFLLA